MQFSRFKLNNIMPMNTGAIRSGAVGYIKSVIADSVKIVDLELHNDWLIATLSSDTKVKVRNSAY